MSSFTVNSQELTVRGFSLDEGSENGGILYVFPAFGTERIGKNIHCVQPKGIYSELP